MVTFNRIVLTPVALFVGLIVAGAAVSKAAEIASVAAPETGGPLTCEIQKAAKGGMVSLAAVVRSDKAIGGSYMFSVVSSGGGNSSTINQGGPFTASANKATTIGSATLGTGSSYKATLTVSVDGQTIKCSDAATA